MRQRFSLYKESNKVKIDTFGKEVNRWTSSLHELRVRSTFDRIYAVLKAKKAAFSMGMSFLADLSLI
jgi:hypothetical protein